VAKQFAILDRHLGGREYMRDRGRSIIDAYTFPMIRCATKLLPGRLTEFPNVQALHDRIAGRSGDAAGAGARKGRRT